MIYVRLHPEPIQGGGFRSVVDNDPLFAASKKFPTDEDVKKDV
jgi:hypothetical protein